MAANPLAEKRRLRKLENQRLEEEAKWRQEELRHAQELEQQRIECERAAEQQQQLFERESVRLARQAERDRIARLEQAERATVSRIEAQLCNVGAFCAGELSLPSRRVALPLSLSVLTLSALDPPLADAPESDAVVFVADSGCQLHAFDLGSRALLFSAAFSPLNEASALRTPSAMDRHRCVFIDLRALFALHRAAVATTTFTGASTIAGNDAGVLLFDGSAAITFALGGTESELFASPRGVAFDDTARELFVSDQANHRVVVYAVAPDLQKPRGASSTRAPLTLARAFGAKGHDRGQLQYPSGLDTSHYHVVVCDTGNHRLVVFAKRGGFVCTIGAKGSCGGEFHDIRDVALVNVRKRVQLRGLSPDESAISSEQFEIVVADLGNFRIHVLSASGAFLRQLSLLGSSEQIAFQRAQFSAWRTDLLREFAALHGNARSLPSLSGDAMAQLYALARSLHPSCPAYARITTAQAQWRDARARYHHPLALAYAPSSHELAFVDHENARVFVYNADGSRTKWLNVEALEQPPPLSQHRVLSSVHSVLQIDFRGHCDSNQLALSAGSTQQSRRLYVSDPQSHRIAVLDAASLQFLFYVGAATYGDQTLCSSGYFPGELQHPTFLACVARPTSSGTDASSSSGSSITTTHESSLLLVVSDSGNHSVSLFDAWSGCFCGRVGEGFGHLEAFLDSPQGVAVLYNRWLYVCDQRNHRVQVFDLVDSSARVRTFGREGSAPGELRFPTGVAVCAELPRGDPACNFGTHRDAKVVVSDTGNHRVQVFAVADLQVLLVLDVHHTPFDQVLEPIGVCVEPRSGCVLVCDAANKCVLIFHRDGAFLASFGSTVEPENRFERPMALAQHNTTLLVADAGRCDVSAFELREH